MESIIPCHTLNVLTSTLAKNEDVRANKLADKIFEAQRREIMKMQWWINDNEPI